MPGRRRPGLVVIAAAAVVLAGAGVAYLRQATIAVAPCRHVSYAAHASTAMTTPIDEAYIFFNASDAKCALKAPVLSYIDPSGASLHLAQDWGSGAQDQTLVVAAHKPASVPVSMTQQDCSEELQYVRIVADFGGTAQTRIPESGQVCSTTRVKVWAPAFASRCAGFDYAWTGASGTLHGCSGDQPAAIRPYN